MVGRSYTPRQFAEFTRGLPKKLNAAVITGIRNGSQQALTVVAQAGNKAPPASPHGKKGAFDTGAYFRGWKVTHLPNGARVYNATAYADIIERGRRRGRRPPPSKAIELWARRRLGLSAKEAKAAAFPIARAIGRRGLKGRRVLASAKLPMMKVVMAEVRREVRKALSGGA